ncbi:MAG: TrkA family potassium uptake protein [Oscillospiraceae bacterium]|nr:TrkA family potassium uptake protein [Oscillospiraceae bacterium]
MAKSFAVLGMGRFGTSIARSLYESGEDVMAVDKDEDLMEALASKVTYAVTADLSDEDSVKELGLGDMDAVVVATGKDLESSILCVMVAKEQGVPLVLAKARNKRMGDILTRIGADRIIYPEEETGVRIAKSLVSKDFLDFFELSDKLCLIEMKTKEEWIGKNLRQLDLKREYSINIVAIRHGKDGEYNHMINPDTPFAADDTILLIVETKNLFRIS